MHTSHQIKYYFLYNLFLSDFTYNNTLLYGGHVIIDMPRFFQRGAQFLADLSFF